MSIRPKGRGARVQARRKSEESMEFPRELRLDPHRDAFRPQSRISMRREIAGGFNMDLLHRASSDGIGQLLAATSFFSSRYVQFTVLAVVMIIVFTYAYRVWEEVHDVEDPDSPSDLLDSFEQAHAEGELDAQELNRLRKLLLDGQGIEGERAVASDPPRAPSLATRDPSAKEDAEPVDTSEDHPHDPPT